MKKLLQQILPVTLAIGMLLSGCASPSQSALATASSESSTVTSSSSESTSEDASSSTSFSLKSIPTFSKNAYAPVNGNKPYFKSTDFTTKAFEKYSALDNLGRCGVAFANVCTETMPTEKRGEIGSVKPSGWQLAKYDCVDGKYLYNRCHLIGYQLTAENANPKNLITGTRYLNVDGMLPFENMVADYVKETDHHVLYRVTPIFQGNNLVASGVLMEAESVEDKGDSICFCVYCYNNQPGVAINYATGKSHLSGNTETASNNIQQDANSENTDNTTNQTYILNTNTKKFHLPSCPSISTMSSSNKKTYTGKRSDLLAQGYSPCARCKP